ncbi:SigB/SigF/SigG family RNA polymerase sigma factor [[Eubacterium] hominis]|uniref:SigB/SigF/SigG family RNA polymerase sigma factor n=1 Tax=[Eubacterium] hominis TaxID=2764325 RepID=UPI003A4DB504
METKKSNEELIALIQQGDKEARDEFVKANTPLVYAIVKRFHKPRQSNDDLFQIGCVGLMKALNHFDVSYGVKFSTYAVPIIMGEIKRYFRDDGSMRISRSIKEGYLTMLKSKEALFQKLHHEPTYQEIADDLGMDVGDVIVAFEANQFVYSLDETIYENDGSPIVLEDKVKNRKEEDVVMSVSLKEEIKRLDARDQLLLHYRYDLSMKQEDIAKKLNVSQVQVSRLEKKILKKLKERLVND